MSDVFTYIVQLVTQLLALLPPLQSSCLLNNYHWKIQPVIFALFFERHAAEYFLFLARQVEHVLKPGSGNAPHLGHLPCLLQWFLRVFIQACPLLSLYFFWNIRYLSWHAGQWLNLPLSLPHVAHKPLARSLWYLL